jgi:hypothetical protein
MSYGAASLTKYVSPTMGLQFLLGTHYYSSGEEMPDPDNAGKMTDPDPLMDVSLGARGLFGLMGGKRSTLAFVAGLGFSMHRKEAVDSKFLTDVNLELGLRAEHFFSPEFAVNCLTGLSITYGLENEDAGRTKSFMAADLAGAMFGGAGFTFYFP